MPVTLSVVVPAYTFDKEIEAMTLQGIASMIDQVDEFILIEDGGMYSYQIMGAVDKYLFSKENQGFTKAANCGLKIATGEFIAIVNTDIQLVSGNLLDLCVPGRVTSPIYSNQDWGEDGGLAGSFFVIPREVRDTRGLLDERFKTWASDGDYNHRVSDIYQRINTVLVHHEIGFTNKRVGLIDESADRQLCLEKYREQNL